MSWNIAWSWQAESRIATLAPAEGGVLVSAGLEMTMLEADGAVRWHVEVPFKVHAAQAVQGTVGLLAAHGFYLMSTSNGAMMNEGRSTPGGFSDLAARPGGDGGSPQAQMHEQRIHGREGAWVNPPLPCRFIPGWDPTSCVLPLWSPGGRPLLLRPRYWCASGDLVPNGGRREHLIG